MTRFAKIYVWIVRKVLEMQAPRDIVLLRFYFKRWCYIMLPNDWLYNALLALWRRIPYEWTIPPQYRCKRNS